LDTSAGSTNKPHSLHNTHNATLAELEKYKLLVENIQDYAIFLMDRNGYIMTWNKGAERNKGYKTHEIVGKHFSTFYLQRDKDAKKPERELEIAKKFGRVEDEDWRVRKDGSQFWANVVITALYDTDDKLVGFAKVTRDLTDRKQQENVLRQANALLRRQQKELEQLSLSKDEFISLASHQLRTPATAIKQLLGLLLEGFMGELDARQQRVIEKANESNERQIAIVNSLLRVAQIDGGKVLLRKSPVNIPKLFHELVGEQADTITRRNQTIRIKTAKALPEAFIDKEHFGMALANLVDNASKYTPAGGSISLSARTLGNELVITCKDSGVGIAPNDLDKLFVKFTRIPNELSQEVGGSGLGLYWAHKVILLHKGRVDVSSEPGSGTTFTIHLPLEEENA
jgi:PAS domain S-box-containing protein